MPYIHNHVRVKKAVNLLQLLNFLIRRFFNKNLTIKLDNYEKYIIHIKKMKILL